MTPILFLDRDGVINADSPDFVRSVEEWRPLPGSLEAIGRLARGGWEVVVVTNQSGLARGLLDGATLEAIHGEMARRIADHGGRLAGVFHCPHAPEAGCRCRKPQPGLIERACAELGLDASGMPLVGDRESDLIAARRAGLRPIAVRSGPAPPFAEGTPVWRDVPVFRDLAEVADHLLAGAPPGRALAQ